MTKPGDEKERLDQKSDEKIELSKETLADLDTPEETAEEAVGGAVPPTFGCSGEGCV